MATSPRAVLVDAAQPPPLMGDLAPDFRLRRSFEEDVTLSDRTGEGPVVLAFYVFDFGSV